MAGHLYEKLFQVIILTGPKNYMIMSIGNLIMISTYITIPEDCHIIVNGIDFAGREVHNIFHRLDGTGQFTVDYTIEGNICQQRTFLLDKTQDKQIQIAFTKHRLIDLEKRIEEEKDRLVKLIDTITEE